MQDSQSTQTSFTVVVASVLYDQCGFPIEFSASAKDKPRSAMFFAFLAGSKVKRILFIATAIIAHSLLKMEAGQQGMDFAALNAAPI